MQKTRFIQMVCMLVLAWLFLLIAADRADAQDVQCGDTKEVIQYLTETHGVQPRAFRYVDAMPGGVVAVWSNPRTGVFVVLVHPESTLTCVLQTGVSAALIERVA